jgi:hypothetical protein
VVFVADALGGWLVGLLADAGRKRLTDWVLGSGQERALRQAATSAVRLTATDLYPEGDERAGQLAMVISHVFSDPVPNAPLAERAMLLDALKTGITDQLAILDDADVTEIGKSAADVLGVSVTVLSQKLTGHLVREIIVRGAQGDPLEPLAAQLNHDVTHLQGQRLQEMFGQLTGETREVFARLGNRDHQERTPRLDARVTTHLAVPGRNGLPYYLLELRLLGPNDLDGVDVYIEDGQWLAFTAHQADVNRPFGVGYAMGDFSPEATLISCHASHTRPLRVGGEPASWRVQLANVPLTTGDQAPCLRVECRAAEESWCVAVSVRDAEILLDHPVIRRILGPSWPGPRPVRWPPDVPPGQAGKPG